MQLDPSIYCLDCIYHYDTARWNCYSVELNFVRFLSFLIERYASQNSLHTCYIQLHKEELQASQKAVHSCTPKHTQQHIDCQVVGQGSRRSCTSYSQGQFVSRCPQHAYSGGQGLTARSIVAGLVGYQGSPWSWSRSSTSTTSSNPFFLGDFLLHIQAAKCINFHTQLQKD